MCPSRPVFSAPRLFLFLLPLPSPPPPLVTSPVFITPHQQERGWVKSPPRVQALQAESLFPFRRGERKGLLLSTRSSGRGLLYHGWIPRPVDTLGEFGSPPVAPGGQLVPALGKGRCLRCPPRKEKGRYRETLILEKDPQELCCGRDRRLDGGAVRNGGSSFSRTAAPRPANPAPEPQEVHPRC